MALILILAFLLNLVFGTLLELFNLRWGLVFSQALFIAGPVFVALRLFYLDGTLSAREIAQRMGVGKSAVTMRLERFRARVRRELCEKLDPALAG